MIEALGEMVAMLVWMVTDEASEAATVSDQMGTLGPHQKDVAEPGQRSVWRRAMGKIIEVRGGEEAMTEQMTEVRGEKMR